jgi:hypothetical protein
MPAPSRKPMTSRINEIESANRQHDHAAPSLHANTPILDRNLIERARTFAMAVPKELLLRPDWPSIRRQANALAAEPALTAMRARRPAGADHFGGQLWT